MLDAQKAAIKNWDRIRNMKANPLLILSHKNAHKESLTWKSSIKLFLERNGMQNESQSEPSNTNNTHKKTFNRTNDIFHQESFSTIKSVSSKLRTYGLFKNTIGREDYLEQIRNTKNRSCLTRFRLSNHKLMIEVGRHQNLQKHERICQVCKKYVEDEIHFLINCKLYEELRKPIFENCIKEKTSFPYYTDEEKFIYIMTSSDLTFKLATFLNKPELSRTCDDQTRTRL